MSIKIRADYILYDCGLLDELSKYGVPHIIGSYRTNTMAWNDLDIDIENDNMSLDKLHHLSEFIINKFHPTWYEAKQEFNSENKIVWFHGFETIIENNLWNIDLWFLDKEEINSAIKYCDMISQQIQVSPALKDQIIQLKKELIARKLYSFDQYTSMDVYHAVLNQRISNVEDFIAHYQKSHI